MRPPRLPRRDLWSSLWVSKRSVPRQPPPLPRDRDWMSGFALAGRLTQIPEALRRFAFARCRGTSRASIPHDLAGRSSVRLGVRAAADSASRASSRSRSIAASRILAGLCRFRPSPAPLSASCSCLRLMVVSSTSMEDLHLQLRLHAKRTRADRPSPAGALRRAIRTATDTLESLVVDRLSRARNPGKPRARVGRTRGVTDER